MRIITNGKRLPICLLLCSLLLLGYYNCGIFSSAPFSSSGLNRFDTACSSGVSQNSSMSDRSYTGLDFIGAVNDCTRFIISSSGKSRGLGFKNNYSFFAAVSAAYVAALINYLRLSKEIYNQFDSRQIITCLHKKDGMK